MELDAERRQVAMLDGHHHAAAAGGHGQHVRQLGIGHQSLVQAFGGTVVRHVPVHGKATDIEHDGSGLFEGLPSPLTVGRYHSLVADPELPDSLEVTARGGGVVMAVRHRELPALGVQFHPESVLTPDGKRLLENFLGELDPH